VVFAGACSADNGVSDRELRGQETLGGSRVFGCGEAVRSGYRSKGCSRPVESGFAVPGSPARLLSRVNHLAHRPRTPPFTRKEA
jgi:hypothetical protein